MGFPELANQAVDDSSMLEGIFHLCAWVCVCVIVGKEGLQCEHL